MRRAAAIGLACVLALGACAAPTLVRSPSPSPPAPTPLPTSGSSAETGIVVRAAVMAVPRAAHTATRLGFGQILVAGGCTTDGCELGSPGGATAGLFDPATGAFASTGSLTVSRDDHAAALLPNGRVILIGGWGASGVLASTDVYDPSTGSFSPGPTMRSARSGVVAIALGDTRLLIAGGFTDNRPTIAASEIFDPGTGAMTPTGDMTVPRGAYAAALLHDGRVLIAGGLSDGTVTASAELYDPATDTFAATGPMRTARYKGGAATLPDGTVLVFGGSGDIEGTILYASTEIFDPVSGTFSGGPSMHSPRYKLSNASVVLAGDVLVAGGAPQPEVYRFASRSFVPVRGSLDATRLFLAAAPIDGHRALLTGGYDNAIRPTAATWLFDDR